MAATPHGQAQNCKGRRYRRKQRKLVNSENISHERKHIELQQWLSQNGVKYHHLRPANFKTTGRGLMTVKAYKDGDVIISIPKKLLITTQVALESELKDVIVRFPKKLTARLIICAFLIIEKMKGSSSFWAPYIRCLPESFDTPAYFTEEELSLLPDSLQVKSKEQRVKIQQEFRKLKQFFRFAKEFNICKGEELSLSFFKWAWFVVNTRSLYMEESYSAGRYLDPSEKDVYVLAPFLDLLNHSPEVDVTGAYNPSNDCYEISTVTPFHRYDQVFIYYGPHDNKTLLLDYGFVVPSNPHSVVQISLDDVVKMSAGHMESTFPEDYAIEERQKVITENHLWDFSCSLNGLSWHLAICLDILCLDPNQFGREEWKSIVAGHETPDNCKDRSTRVAKNVLKQYLEETSKKCQEISAVGHQTDHILMVLQLFHEEEEILTNCLSKL
ncbi:SET domain-containing protein 4 [Holothuria leucospilota]|uniref:SET domain-containing protein 4 n=1 Tax=Holothuria leucospilota TaxID=206669 RepID=A0A9Q1H0J7_HOLLE|nr:SET domain-containing protein 4 [Holothuria leucospilota]